MMKMIDHHELDLGVRTSAYLMLAFYIRKRLGRPDDQRSVFQNGAQPISRLRRLAGSHLSPGAQCELAIAEWLGVDIVDFQVQKALCQADFLEFLMKCDNENPTPLLRAIAQLPEPEFQKILELEPYKKKCSSTP
jgi:hypothetical protein